MAGSIQSVLFSNVPCPPRRLSSPSTARVLPPPPSLNPRKPSFTAFEGLIVSRSAERRRGAVICEAQGAAVKGTNPPPAVSPVTESSWRSQVLEDDLPVVVLFTAPWCGPCRAFYPVVAEISAEFSGRIKCYELDTDENKEIATAYGIRSIPTVLFFLGGEKKEAIIGSVPKKTLVASLAKLFSAD